MTAEQRRAYADPDRICHVYGCTEPAGTPSCLFLCADHENEYVDRNFRPLGARTERLYTQEYPNNKET